MRRFTFVDFLELVGALEYVLEQAGATEAELRRQEGYGTIMWGNVYLKMKLPNDKELYELWTTINFCVNAFPGLHEGV